MKNITLAIGRAEHWLLHVLRRSWLRYDAWCAQQAIKHANQRLLSLDRYEQEIPMLRSLRLRERAESQDKLIALQGELASHDGVLQRD